MALISALLYLLWDAGMLYLLWVAFTKSCEAGVLRFGQGIDIKELRKRLCGCQTGNLPEGQ